MRWFALPILCLALCAAVPAEEIDLLAAGLPDSWLGDRGLWSFENGELVGRSTVDVERNQFLYPDVRVADFRLSVEVRLLPDERNSGIQFRSQRLESGQAVGYQADIGMGVWGKLYEEQGRGKLVWNDEGLRGLRPGEWNRVEILALGHDVWLAVNGRLSVSAHDPAGEIEGLLGFQLHRGPPVEVRFRDLRLDTQPDARLAGLDRAQLEAALEPVDPDPRAVPPGSSRRLVTP